MALKASAANFSAGGRANNFQEAQSWYYRTSIICFGIMSSDTEVFSKVVNLPAQVHFTVRELGFEFDLGEPAAAATGAPGRGFRFSIRCVLGLAYILTTGAKKMLYKPALNFSAAQRIWDAAVGWPKEVAG